MSTCIIPSQKTAGMKTSLRGTCQFRGMGRKVRNITAALSSPRLSKTSSVRATRSAIYHEAIVSRTLLLQTTLLKPNAGIQALFGAKSMVGSSLGPVHRQSHGTQSSMKLNAGTQPTQPTHAQYFSCDPSYGTASTMPFVVSNAHSMRFRAIFFFGNRFPEQAQARQQIRNVKKCPQILLLLVSGPDPTMLRNTLWVGFAWQSGFCQIVDASLPSKKGRLFSCLR